MEKNLKSSSSFKDCILNTLEKIANDDSAADPVRSPEELIKDSPFTVPESLRENRRSFRICENNEETQFTVSVIDLELNSLKNSEENKDCILNSNFRPIERTNFGPGKTEEVLKKNPFARRPLNHSANPTSRLELKKYSSERDREYVYDIYDKSIGAQGVENDYKQIKDENEFLKRKLETLKIAMNEGKESSEKKVFFLTQEIKTLKSQNFELLQKLSKKKDQEKGSFIKKSATKIDEKELDYMNKETLLESISKLKEENSKMSSRVLEQADELFEKNNEIVHLQIQKNELFSQVNILSEENKEIAELKEHVNYLLNTVRMLKESLPKLVESYKLKRPKRQNSSEGSNDEVLDTIDRMSDIMNDNLQRIVEKKQGRLNLVNSFGGSQLVYSLQNKVKEIMSEKKN